MFGNYVKVVIRLINRQKIYSLINLSGLTIGLASGILILLFIDFELGYDRFHENGENIYRVVMRQPGNKVMGSSTDWWIVSPAILKPTWERELPDIEMIARTGVISAVIHKNGQLFDERFMVADPGFLDIFTFPLLTGDKTTALNEPFSIILTERMAEKYFGNEDPTGKTLSVDNKYEYKITGVLEDIPENSHIKFGFVVSFQTLNTVWTWKWQTDNWLNNPFDTYLTLKEGVNPEVFDAKLRKYDIQGFNNNTWTFHVQPLYDIHFNREISGDGDIRYIYIFSAVALFILFIACFNFINLSTARFSTRAKEIGIRKVVGAGRNQLIKQLIGESLLYAFAAMVLSVILARLFLPFLNNITGHEIEFTVLRDIRILSLIFAVTLGVGLISGIYPALILSSFQPVNIMKGSYRHTRKGALYFRNSLVVVQFAISIVMIISTVVLSYQMDYIRNKKLGFNSEHIIGLRNRGIDTELFRKELLKNPDILKVAGSSHLPVRIGWSNIPAWDGKDEDDNPFFYRLNVDFDFFDLYNLEIVNGRAFSDEYGEDRGKAYILNEAAVKRLGWDNPVGQNFGFWRITGKVVGVVKDFNFESLHKPVTPLGIGVYDRNTFSYVSVKIRPDNVAKTIQYIEDEWEKFAPDYPFEYSFIDERLDNMYKSEQRMAVSFNYFTGIAIFIACLGLFGLSSFIAENRTKEIGIRKVLGASVSSVVVLITKEIFLLILCANIIAWPLAWFAMQKWLDNFAYKVDMDITMFFAAAMAAFIIALMTMSYQSLKAALSNPVDALRYE